MSFFSVAGSTQVTALTPSGLSEGERPPGFRRGNFSPSETSPSGEGLRVYGVPGVRGYDGEEERRHENPAGFSGGAGLG